MCSNNWTFQFFGILIPLNLLQVQTKQMKSEITYYVVCLPKNKT